MKLRNQTTIFFIRHGQTPSNSRGVQQGDKIDDYLNTQGILQIEKLAKIAASLDLDILFTSYLHRAEETSAIIENQLTSPIPIMHDFRLRERDFGSLTGKKLREWDLLVPGHAEAEAMQMYNYRPFGGENVDDVRLRAISAILDIISNYDHQNIGIVTHAGIIRLMLFHFPEITRIYHTESTLESNIGNSDVYEWEIGETQIKNLKSLL